MHERRVSPTTLRLVAALLLWCASAEGAWNVDRYSNPFPAAMTTFHGCEYDHTSLMHICLGCDGSSCRIFGVAPIASPVVLVGGIETNVRSFVVKSQRRLVYLYLSNGRLYQYYMDNWGASRLDTGFSFSGQTYTPDPVNNPGFFCTTTAPLQLTVTSSGVAVGMSEGLTCESRIEVVEYAVPPVGSTTGGAFTRWSQAASGGGGVTGVTVREDIAYFVTNSRSIWQVNTNTNSLALLRTLSATCGNGAALSGLTIAVRALASELVLTGQPCNVVQTLSLVNPGTATVTTFAGDGTSGYADGPALSKAVLRAPRWPSVLGFRVYVLTVDSDGASMVMRHIGATMTMTLTLSASMSNERSLSESVTVSLSPSQSQSRTTSISFSEAESDSMSLTRSASVTMSLSESGTTTASFTETLSSMPSATETGSVSDSWSITFSASNTFSATLSLSPTLSNASSTSLSMSPTEESSRTVTLLATDTVMPTFSHSPSQAASRSETLVATPTPSSDTTMTATISNSSVASSSVTERWSASGSEEETISDTLSWSSTVTVHPSDSSTMPSSQTLGPTNTYDPLSVLLGEKAARQESPSMTPSSDTTGTVTESLSSDATQTASGSRSVSSSLTAALWSMSASATSSFSPSSDAASRSGTASMSTPVSSSATTSLTVFTESASSSAEWTGTKSISQTLTNSRSLSGTATRSSTRTARTGSRSSSGDNASRTLTEEQTPSLDVWLTDSRTTTPSHPKVSWTPTATIPSLRPSTTLSFYYVVAAGVAVAAVGSLVAIGVGVHAAVTAGSGATAAAALSSGIGGGASIPSGGTAVVVASTASGEAIQPTTAAESFAMVVEQPMWHMEEGEPFAEEADGEELPWWATRKAPPPPTFESISAIRGGDEKDFAPF